MKGSEEKSIWKAAGVVGLFTLLSRVLGLVRDIVVATLFGSGMAADAFFVAFRIPNLLRRLFAEGSLTIAFIPVFSEYLATRSRQDAFDLARTVLTVLSLILVVVTLLGVLGAPWIVRIQAFGFEAGGARHELTVLLTRITFPYIFFISIVAFFMGVLNSLRRFAAPAAAPIFLNVGMIGAAYFISPHCPEPVMGLAIGVLIGGVLQVVIQIPWLIKEGLRIFPRWDPGHPALRRIGLLMLPAIFGAAVYQFNQFVGTLLASFLPEGSISWLYYADRLVQFPLGVFAITMSTVALPSLSTQAAKKEEAGFARTLSHSLRMVFFVTIPSMAGLIVLREPIVMVLFERGAFDSVSTAMTAKALFYYVLGLWAFSGIRVMVSAFYALQDTRTPVQVAVAALTANAAFSLLLMGPMRHGGLALALTLASTLQFCLLVVMLRRKIRDFRLGSVAGAACRCLASALVMWVGLKVLQATILPFNAGGAFAEKAAGLLLLVAAGFVLFIVAARVFRCEELVSLKDMVEPFFRRLGLKRGKHG
ncbi:MAG TPA: murein biosynthesis integral membrane protein MurJ [Desulfobacteraceae bacterium]|nr:murein biosynthesis integral membrane protein MurJ [Desulfobacteraceae bacterium]